MLFIVHYIVPDLPLCLGVL